MTYTINGVQYWRRNGIYCSWTMEDGRKVISKEEYVEALSKKESNIINSAKSEEIEIIKDPKSKIEILYQEINKNDKIVNKKKVITYGNLEKVLANMENKDNFVKILATRDV